MIAQSHGGQLQKEKQLTAERQIDLCFFKFILTGIIKNYLIALTSDCSNVSHHLEHHLKH